MYPKRLRNSGSANVTERSSAYDVGAGHGDMDDPVKCTLSGIEIETRRPSA